MPLGTPARKLGFSASGPISVWNSRVPALVCVRDTTYVPLQLSRIEASPAGPVPRTSLSSFT